MASAGKSAENPAISKSSLAALLALAGICTHLILKYGFRLGSLQSEIPLLIVLAVAGSTLVAGRIWTALHAEFGSDHLAAISVVTSILLGEYLAGAIIVLMYWGGETLEEHAVAQATSVLRALASRVPTLAHRQAPDGLKDVPVGDIRVDDQLTVLPHEICPVDGEVTRGNGTMNESYLTGEPFEISKVPGTQVLSGAINGEAALTIRATRVAADSRFARILHVMQEAEQRRPELRRIGDQLGAWYTPLALALAAGAWWASHDPDRFLAVVVVATPCPLLIAIPVAIIGAISAAARRGVIVKDPAALEQLALCRTMILDKTGTLTYGRPSVSAERYFEPFTREETLPAIAALEQFSRHPLAGALVKAASDARYVLPHVEWIREEAGVGLRGRVGAATLLVTGRAQASSRFMLPPIQSTGMECFAIVDDQLAAAFQFHDVARDEGRGFVDHLAPKHGMSRVLLLSGDREAEVRKLADAVGITEVTAGASPEEKVAIVRDETTRAKTVFVGDGINDAPALMAATIGIAFGQHSDVTSEAARLVIIDSSLSKVDEIIHISQRLRRVALQSAVGGMALSAMGMGLAAFGLLTPIAGAVAQEAIDLVAVLNALRTSRTQSDLTDFDR